MNDENRENRDNVNNVSLIHCYCHSHSAVNHHLQTSTPLLHFDEYTKFYFKSLTYMISYNLYIKKSYTNYTFSLLFQSNDLSNYDLLIRPKSTIIII